METQAHVLEGKGPGRVSPFTVPMMIPNMATGLAAIALGTKGPSSAVATACAAGSNAVGDAFRLLQLGKADAMVCGGAEPAITPLGVAGFASAKALSFRNDDPTSASRPFDKDRDGFVIGEGAGILVLETLEHAQSRGAMILGEVIGYGMTCDAHHITSPTPAVSVVRKPCVSPLAMPDSRLTQWITSTPTAPAPCQRQKRDIGHQKCLGRSRTSDPRQLDQINDGSPVGWLRRHRSGGVRTRPSKRRCSPHDQSQHTRSRV